MSSTSTCLKKSCFSRITEVVVNKDTSEDNRVYLCTKLQNVVVKSEKNIINTSFVKSQ